jgi:hypothetical protein
MSPKLKAYEVTYLGQYPSVICAFTAGKAKYQRLLSLQDAGIDATFKDLGCKSVSRPATDENFKKTAEYRDVPFAQIGMTVMVGDSPGYIVGKNSSANFRILFTGGKYRGQTLSCHPNWEIAYFDGKGNCLADFRKSKTP